MAAPWMNNGMIFQYIKKKKQKSIFFILISFSLHLKWTEASEKARLVLLWVSNRIKMISNKPLWFNGMFSTGQFFLEYIHESLTVPKRIKIYWLIRKKKYRS